MQQADYGVSRGLEGTVAPYLEPGVEFYHAKEICEISRTFSVIEHHHSTLDY